MPEPYRVGRPDAAKLDDVHSCSFGTNDSSSEEIGMRSGHNGVLTLVGDFGLILMGTSIPWLPELDEEAVKFTTGVECWG